jgi:hypothetical protein
VQSLPQLSSLPRQRPPNINEPEIEDGDDDADADMAENESEAAAYPDPMEGVAGLDEQVTDHPTAPTLATVLLATFDWIARHKATDASAEDMWAILRGCCDRERFPLVFSKAEAILKRHIASTMKIVDVCRNDCVAYWDCSSPEMSHYKYSGLKHCPNINCGLPRYVYDLQGNEHASKVMYYFPIAKYVADLYQRIDLIPFMSQDYQNDSLPKGHIRKSNGWKQKVTDNPKMNGDPRNQAFIMSTDGVPYFRDFGSRSGWPVVIRNAGLPDGLWGHMAHVHMVAFQASDYKVKNTVTGKLDTMKKNPTSLTSTVGALITDELLRGQNFGYRIRDMSRSEGDPGAFFNCRVCLLFCVGDYPAQGTFSGFQHSGKPFCHWCTMLGKTCEGINRSTCACNRRYLPENHKLREKMDTLNGRPEFKEAETRPPPPPRTHDVVVEDARLTKAYADAKKAKRRSPHKESGVKFVCYFALLFLFDMVWDFLPDMMHIVKAILHGHLYPLLKGERDPKYPNYLPMVHGDGTPYTPALKTVRSKQNDVSRKNYSNAMKVTHSLSVTRFVLFCFVLFCFVLFVLFCAPTHTHTHTHTHPHVYVDTHTHVHTHIHTYICTHTHTYTLHTRMSHTRKYTLFMSGDDRVVDEA